MSIFICIINLGSTIKMKIAIFSDLPCVFVSKKKKKKRKKKKNNCFTLLKKVYCMYKSLLIFLVKFVCRYIRTTFLLTCMC